MSLVAGNRAYWISRAAADQFSGLHGVAGAGAAIALVDAVKQIDASRAEFVIEDWIVTVKKTATS